MLRKIVCGLAASMILAGAAAAQEPDPERLALAEEMFQLSDGRQMIQQTVEQMQALQTQIIQQQAAMQGVEVDARMLERINEITVEELTVAMEPLIGRVAPIYAEVFTAEEMQGAIDFYRSEAGQALLAKSQTINERMMAAAAQWAQVAMPHLQERLMVRFEEEFGDSGLDFDGAL